MENKYKIKFMQRILIRNIKDNLDKEILIKGRIINLRKLGSISFALVQDYTGAAQTVWEKEISVKMGDAVELTGVAKEDKRAKGGFEISGENIKVVSTSVEDYPFDLAKNDLNLQLTTLLDRRSLSLRHPKIQAIFKLYDLILESYEKTMRNEDFVEIKTPKFVETASEGGANFFKVQYFDKFAYLAQSPQLYKQIMVGVFERVFEIGSAFRAEPSFTTRHVTEYISLDAEMGFIQDYCDITKTLNRILREMFKMIGEGGQEFLKLHEIELSEVPEEIPYLKLSEAREIVKKKYNYEIPEETDIDPEGERLASQYAKEEFNSDFLFITHYPWKDRPFYTMPSREDEKETYGFDLIYKGVEIVTGGQRIHLYDQLIENMEKKGVSSVGLESYIETFKFAMPPHGGWAIGSERLLQHILNLKNIKEGVLFPRDVKRLNP